MHFARGTLRISMEFHAFCKGYPLGFQWNSIDFARGGPWDFNGIPYILQGVPLRISMEVLAFCKGSPKDFN